MTRPVDTTAVTDSNGDVSNTYNTANGTGLAVRTKINDVFTALRTISAGSGDPSGVKNVVPFQPHINTSTNELKICTAVSGTGVSLTGTFTTIGNITQTNLGLLPKAGGTLTGVLTAATGSTSAPSLNFGDSSTGFYKVSTNVIGLIANQEEVAFFDQNSFTIDNSKELRLLENSGSEYIALKAPSSISSNRTITFPNETGTVLTNATSIANSNLANSSITVGSTAISLGSSATTVAGLTSLTSTTLVATSVQATNLKGTNIQDTSGNNGSTPEQIQKGRAKAWVIFGNDGGKNADFGVTSVDDNGTGNYIINFSSAFANVNYAFALSAGRGTGSGARFVTQEGTTGKTTTQFHLKVRNSNNSQADTTEVSAIFYAA